MQATLATDADILRQIEAFCDEHDIKPTKFGRLALGDGNLVTNLRADRSLTLKTAGRVLEFMASHAAGVGAGAGAEA